MVFAEFVEVVLVRIAGIEVLADALEAGGQDQGGGEIGIAGGVGGTCWRRCETGGVGAVLAGATADGGLELLPRSPSWPWVSLGCCVYRSGR